MSASASTTVHAVAGECLDALVWRATGRGAAAIAIVLAANRGLAAIAAALPEGTVVAIPALPATIASVDLVQLWD